jgi:ribosomal protein S18 acetylase RimI-like enzyme
MIRTILRNELDFAFRLTELENWGTIREELEDIFYFSPNGFFISESNGILEGVVSTVSYGSFGFIGNLIVAEEFRNKGIGTKLMKYAIKYLISLKVNSILLDSVPQMSILYEKLGFKRFCRSLRLECNVINKPTNRVRLMTKEDLNEIFKLDYKLFKGERTFLIQRRFALHPDLSYVLVHKNKITGFLMGIPKEDYITVGPWIVDPKEPEPHLLLQKLINDINYKKIRLGMLEYNPKVIKIISEFNLNEYFYSIRMIYGKKITHKKGVFAIAGPDRG